MSKLYLGREVTVEWKAFDGRPTGKFTTFKTIQIPECGHLVEVNKTIFNRYLNQGKKITVDCRVCGKLISFIPAKECGTCGHRDAPDVLKCDECGRDLPGANASVEARQK